MTVIAWDGKSLAADRMSECESLIRTSVKIVRAKNHSDTILAFTGTWASGIGMAEWYENGAKTYEWPAWQSSADTWARLIVWQAGELPFFYEQVPHKMIVTDPFSAWGSGSHFAMGALAAGADARRAVEIACEFCTTCGVGIDVMSHG